MDDFLLVSHYIWDAGQLEPDSYPGSDLPAVWITPQTHQKYTVVYLWANPVTISHFLCVPHYAWGAGRPEWVSGTKTTAGPCSPSGWQFYTHVGYRSTLAQSINQCRINLGLIDTFPHNRIYIFVLSCYSNTQNSLWETQESNRFRSH